MQTDPVADVLEIVGDRWALRVVRDVALGLRRFDDLHRSTGAPRTVLADRLRRLTDAGILSPRSYRVPGARTRSEYALTTAGVDLLPVLAALSDWGERHRPGGGEPEIVYRHIGCGGRVTATLQCECGRTTAPGDRLVAQVNR
ncbi:winged helix-turn-helix transcriptional regulator [Nakamurella endophytica]|uniref:Transcriptional regulator n=1 Tax=Nakamurella endophytica TaxID=1748367 RepID=A0A917SY59_9ACTN|nr:helix-turn-helix domain-containing protein [Nakamurella endophytica]GGM00637.1 transcriptional regulator [Nakamurella endophytica]